VGKVIYPDDMERIKAVRLAMEAADALEDEARATFFHDRSDEAKEAWRRALAEQGAAHRDYWAVTWEYVERLP
jgi:hypothetical protein